MSLLVSPGPRKDQLILQFPSPLSTENFQLGAAFPGFKRWEGRQLIIKSVSANIEYLLEHWPDSEWSDETRYLIDEYHSRKEEEKRTLAIKAISSESLSGSGKYEYKRPPRKHQRKGLILSYNKKAFALLMEQRTGKTKVIIDTAAYLWQQGKLHTLIIVTLNGVHRNWIDNEVPEDLPEWCPRRTFFMRASLTAKHQARYREALEFRDGLRIFAFNVEALSRDGKARDMFEEVLGSGSGVMVAIDEASDCIKTYNSKRTKYLVKFGGRAEYRRILTGTQAPEGNPEELFGQYKFLDPSILGYDTITAYRARYCNVVSIDFTKKEDRNGRDNSVNIVRPGCKNVDELRAKLDPYSFRVLRSECMDLPPKIYKRWPIELTREQRRLYAELRKEFTVEFKGKTLTAALAMTRMIRLQQIVCGWFPMDEEELVAGDTWRKVLPIEKNNPRIETLLDILRTNSDRKAIIWARFRPDLELISKTLGKKAVSYYGGISSDKKAEAYRRFQKDDSIQYFVANPSSAGRGLTLTAATLQVYHSNSFRLGDRLQSEDRPEGDEKKRESTLVIDIEAPGTIESKIIRRLKEKKDFADLINGDPKLLFMEDEED